MLPILNDTAFEDTFGYSLSLECTRTSGVGPLSVFFDLTGSTFNYEDTLLLSDFRWDFGDPTSDYNEGVGFCVGHVYENTGTYTATCTFTSPQNQTATISQEITVSAFSGTTYYISA